MNLDEIDSLLKENKLNDALLQTLIELNKSFNFNDPEGNRLFNDLVDKYQMIEKDFFEKLNNDIYLSNTTRSSKIIPSPINKLNSIEKGKYFIDALKYIKIERCSYNNLPKAEAIILILFDSNLDTSLKSRFDINPEFIFAAEPGKYSSKLGSDNETIYCLQAVINSNGIDPLQVLEGFSKLIISIINQEITDVKILFILKNERKDQEIQKFLMGYTIWQLLFLISSFHNSTILPTFTYLFNDEINKNTFERTVLRLRAPEPSKSQISSYSPERVAHLAKRALTQDDSYIKQLNSITRIIDEEDVPLLILGESGVGKSVLAKIIHEESIRNKNNFEEINCGRLNADKLDLDLFGWKKGSFTGSLYDKKGKVTLADKGTLFLDEIDRADTEIRDALLTFLENKSYTVRGEENERTSDVRLIFGTNKDLKKMISNGKFEEDFFYRISERIIIIPPLRNRIDDIELITDYILNDLSTKKDKRIIISKNAIDALKKYSWPGNTRELVRYLRLRYYDCIAEHLDEITPQIIENAPFENIPFGKEEDLDTLIELIKKFLDNWNSSKGDFLHTFLAPIAAKLYIDDSFLNMKRTTKFEEASKIIGISGAAFKTSNLNEYYEAFKNLKKLLEEE